MGRPRSTQISNDRRSLIGNEKELRGVPERVIWAESYFDPAWQQLFDAFNSIPLAVLGMALARWRGAERFVALFASMTLHCVADLLVHREDAHGHFFPFTDWRFMSPVSYWDPAYHGAWFLALELGFVVVGGLVLIRREQRGWRGVGGATLALTLLFAAFALATWGPL